MADRALKPTNPGSVGLGLRSLLYGPLTKEEYDRLSYYSVDVYYGIVHTAEYDARMAQLQAKYDAWLAEEEG